MDRLNLVMIVRDEARCLARCLASARPHVDRMIVLDTGSTDGTPDIAAAAGAVVARAEWHDDFAAARNAALALSDADWNLILDADEWLMRGMAALGEARLPRGAGRFVGCVAVTSGAGAAVSRSLIPRLLPRGVRYQGRVHEQPDTGLPLVELGVEVGHDGYDPAQLARKRGRNLALLEAVLAATPDDSYLLYQLGRERLAAGEAAAAAEALSRAAALTDADAAFRHGLVVRLIQAQVRAGRLDAAFATIAAEESRWAGSADFWFAAAEAFLHAADKSAPDDAFDRLVTAERCWKRCLELGDNRLSGALQGTGSHLAAHNLALLYARFGIADEARRHRALAGRLRKQPPRFAAA